MFGRTGWNGAGGASRPHLPLRGCLSRTGLSSFTTLGEKNKRPLHGAFCFSGGGANLPRTMLSGALPQFPVLPILS